jgi:hypothetical protein
MPFDRLNEAGIKMGLEQCGTLIKHLRLRENEAQVALTRSTDDLNTYKSLIGFAEQTRDFLRERLQIINDEKEKATQQ